MDIIDAHNHPDWHSHDLTRFLANMDAHDIRQTWLLSWEAPADEYEPSVYNRVMMPDSRGYAVPFEACLRYAQAAPDRFVLGYAPDPRRPDAIDRLAAAVDLYGVKTCGEIKLRMMYDNPDALRLFRFAGEKGLPVTVHVEYGVATGRAYPRPDWWYGGGIGALERAVAACPQTIFIGHAPGFWAHISGDDGFARETYPTGPVLPGGKTVEMLRRYPNLWADLSAGSAFTALSRDVEFSREFLEEFQDRMLFGRDYFDNRMAELLHRLHLPDSVLAKIFAGNAQGLVA